MGDTYSAVNLRQTAKEMLLANSKKLDLIPDWRKKLSTRTELTLEVLGELAEAPDVLLCHVHRDGHFAVQNAAERGVLESFGKFILARVYLQYVVDSVLKHVQEDEVPLLLLALLCVRLSSTYNTYRDLLKTKLFVL